MDTIKIKIKIDDTIFEFNKNIFPATSKIDILITTTMNVKKDGDAFILVNENGDLNNFAEVVEFLQTGIINVSDDELIDLITTLDYLNVIHFKTLDYPTEFIKIKLREEWYRLNRHNPYFATTFGNNSRLLILDGEYMSKIKQYYGRSAIAASYHRDYANWYKYNGSCGKGNNSITCNSCLKNPVLMCSPDICIDCAGKGCYNPCGQCYNDLSPREGMLHYNEYIQKKQPIWTKLKDELFEIYGNNLLLFSAITTTINSGVTIFIQDQVNLYYPTEINNQDRLKREISMMLGYPFKYDWMLDESYDDCVTTYLSDTVKILGIKLTNENDNIKTLIVDEFLNDFVIAGGAVLDTISGINTTYKDLDCFLIDVTPEEAYNRISKWLKVLSTDGRINRTWTQYRTQNSITIGKIQFILRIYSDIEELITGFDLDASQVAFNGKNFYATERAKYSLDNRVLTVDFDRMSPTYEKRLAKYMRKKLFSIYVPNFNYHDIDYLNELQPVQDKNITGLGILIKAYLKGELIKYQADYANGGNVVKIDDGKLIKFSDNENLIDIIATDDIEILLKIPDQMYKDNKFALPQKLEFIVQNPGAQVTSTFHQTVLTNIKTWYVMFLKPEPVLVPSEL